MLHIRGLGRSGNSPGAPDGICIYKFTEDWGVRAKARALQMARRTICYIFIGRHRAYKARGRPAVSQRSSAHVGSGFPLAAVLRSHTAVFRSSSGPPLMDFASGFPLNQRFSAQSAVFRSWSSPAVFAHSQRPSAQLAVFRSWTSPAVFRSTSGFPLMDFASGIPLFIARQRYPAQRFSFMDFTSGLPLFITRQRSPLSGYSYPLRVPFSDQRVRLAYNNTTSVCSVIA